jgi:hypothetical protein
MEHASQLPTHDLVSTMRDPGRRFLVHLLATGMASVVHFADNIVRWAAYPEPAWDNVRITDSFWFVMTPVAFAAYWFYRRGRVRAARVASYVYGVMNLSVLGHYLLAWPWQISLVVNGTILLEAGMALWLLVFTGSLEGDGPTPALRRP